MHLSNLLLGLAVLDRALTLRIPVAEVWVGQAIEKRALPEKREAAAEIEGAFQEHQKRIVCLEDSWLVAFQNVPEEATPFCSDYLEIPRSTTTDTVVQRT